MGNRHQNFIDSVTKHMSSDQLATTAMIGVEMEQMVRDIGLEPSPEVYNLILHVVLMCQGTVLVGADPIVAMGIYCVAAIGEGHLNEGEDPS